MESTPRKRSRSLEYDALRLLILVWEMGRQEDQASPRFVDGERQLQILDHLACDETDLASLIIDRVREDGRITAQLAKPVRRLLGRDRRSRLQRNVGQELSLPQPRLWTWQRLDDRLAFLGCRQLLRTSIIRTPNEARSRYSLTERGSLWITNELQQSPIFLACQERCEWMRSILPDWPNVDLRQLVQDVAKRLLDLRADEHIAAEDDLVAFLFPATFGEPL